MRTSSGIIFILTISLIWVFIHIAKEDRDCSDFSIKAQALSVWEKHDTDIYHLDADRDGIPCEGIK